MKLSMGTSHPVWLLVGVGLAGLLVACAAPAGTGEIKSDKERQPVDASADKISELVTGNSEFAFDLYHELRGKGDNLFYSPYSISLALAMTYGGAATTTEEQMAQVLRFTLPQEEVHPTFNGLDGTLESYSQGEDAFQLNIANAIWGQEGYEFQQTYLDLLAQNYGAGLRTLDFAGDGDGAAETINEWVSEQTEDKIKDLIPPGMLNSLVRLVLTNAIYFNGQWVFQFEESATQNDTFTLLDDGTVNVPMMRQTETFMYAAGDGYQAVKLPYQGAPVSMLVLLPEEGRFEEIEQALSADFVQELDGQSMVQSVILTMPKFSFESEFSLNEALVALGMEDAFGAGADFSGMTGSRDLHISDVIHKAFVGVDEAGTEAAAATAVIMVESAMEVVEPVEMKVDRPFIFLISDDDTGTILFAGRVLNPEL